MAEERDKSQQTEAPTQRKLDEARRKGDVAKSPEVGAALSLAAAAGVLIGFGPGISRGAADALLPFIAHPESFGVADGGGQAVMSQALQAAWPAGLVMLAAVAAGVAGHVVQSGLVWAPSKLKPDMSKLNPLSGFGRLFGIDALVGFGKAAIKAFAAGICAWVVVQPHLPEFGGYGALDVAAILPVSAQLLQALAIAVLVVMAVLAGADWLWTRFRSMQKLKMTREEVKQDHKDSDGDPHVKAKQKQLRAQAAKSRMMQAVPKATVVVMNPTHYAVALRYDAGDAAPVCVAKGVDALALRIRAVAEEAQVPVVEDPPLARALHAALDVDESIPREHYEAVAKLIGFVMNKGRPRAGPAASRPLAPSRL